MKKVLVLMCTYNGEKYLKEQIESISNQKSVLVSILARDDGSKDNTLAVLEEYKGKGVLDWYQGDNIGPAAGFMELLYKTGNDDYDYYAFSDQDDIWMPDKLIKAIQTIESSEEEYCLYGSNQTLYKDGKPTKNVYDEMPVLNTPYLLEHNKIAGCTIVINKKLATLISGSKHIDTTILKSRMHDLWLVLVAYVCGKIVFDMRPSMLYRIHGHNVVGEENTSLKTRIKRLKNDRGERSNSRSQYASELLRCFDKEIRQEEREILRLYANYRNSFHEKNEFLHAEEIIKQTGENKTVFRIKILLNYI